jgi:hypothetical protein
VGASLESGQAGGAGGSRAPIAGGSGEPPDRSPAVVALLRSHGSSVQAARNTAQIGKDLRQRMGQTAIEFAALIDATSGQQMGEVLLGSVNQVHLRPHLTALQPGRRYVHVHTHPASSSFSDDDLAILLHHVEVRTIVVVGRDDTWYFLSKLRGRTTVDADTGRALWNVCFAEIASPDHALIAQGVLSSSEALRREVHETMTSLAPEIGLRYDHLEPLR